MSGDAKIERPRQLQLLDLASGATNVLSSQLPIAPPFCVGPDGRSVLATVFEYRADLLERRGRLTESIALFDRAIAIGSGVDHAVLRRFMRKERDIKLSTAEHLAEFLGLELTKKRKARR